MATKKLRHDQVTDLISSEVASLKRIMELLIRFDPLFKRQLALTMLPDPEAYGIESVAGVTYFGLMARTSSMTDPVMSVIAPPEYHDGSLYVETSVQDSLLAEFNEAMCRPLVTRGHGDLCEDHAISVLHDLIGKKNARIAELEILRAGLERMYGSGSVKTRELVVLIARHHKDYQFTSILQKVVPQG